MRCLEEMKAIVDCGELRKFKLTLCQHGLPFKSIAFFTSLLSHQEGSGCCSCGNLTTKYDQRTEKPCTVFCLDPYLV